MCSCVGFFEMFWHLPLGMLRRLYLPPFSITRGPNGVLSLTKQGDALVPFVFKLYASPPRLLSRGLWQLQRHFERLFHEELEYFIRDVLVHTLRPARASPMTTRRSFSGARHLNHLQLSGSLICVARACGVPAHDAPILDLQTSLFEWNPTVRRSLSSPTTRPLHPDTQKTLKC